MALEKVSFLQLKFSLEFCGLLLKSNLTFDLFDFHLRIMAFRSINLVSRLSSFNLCKVYFLLALFSFCRLILM